MRVLPLAIVWLLVTAFGLQAQAAPDAAELTQLLHEFLAGASRNDAAIHDRFWASDLIYTGSAGRRVGKADIMRDVRAAEAPKPGEPVTIFSAEDMRIQQYRNMAIVAFRLVGTTERDGRSEVMNYLNSGTFLKRKGKWQAVNWQATRMPRDEADGKKQIAAAESAFHQSMLASDVKKLESLVDESFIWTHSSGEQHSRQQLLERLGSGQLKFSKLETSNVSVSIYGDSAVVRGVSPRQRASSPGPDPAGHAEPFTIFYTLTFVNRGGEWKAVAMHSSR